MLQTFSFIQRKTKIYVVSENVIGALKIRDNDNAIQLPLFPFEHFTIASHLAKAKVFALNIFA